MKSMNETVRVLMSRDDMTQEEAIERAEEVKELINEALENGNSWEIEDILADELGLELDYLFDFL